MKVLILGINYAPEIVGIGPYTAGMAEWLADAGHEVTVVCAKPYYPQWKVDPDYADGGRSISIENGVRVVRLPTFVPSNPDGKRRLLHHMSFAVAAELAMIAETRRSKPDVVMGIAPSLISIVAARHAARRTGAKLWLHIQDFEVEAAFATGLLNGDTFVGKLARKFERWALSADNISTISPQMCAKLTQKGIPEDKIFEFRNWANLDEITPFSSTSPYRKEWGINTQHVALYSGNVANKQGIEVVLEAAHLLSHRDDLTFVICGQGPNRAKLQSAAERLKNVQLHDLQPRERLNELLGMASVHLMPQLAGAADLVLPSKLTNMLASGRPVVATADPGTGLAGEVAGCGVLTPPGCAVEFARGIEKLIDDPDLSTRCAREGRTRAEERWAKGAILNRLETKMTRLADASQHPAPT